VLRVWIVSALAVGVVVAGVLLWPEDDGGAKTREDAPRPPNSPLDESEVRTYVEVMPQFLATLRKAAEMSVEQGKPPDPAVSQAAVATLLQKHHLSKAGWKLLQDRVEYAVNAIRYETGSDDRNAELEKEIRQKKRLLEEISGPGRKDLEKRIAQLEEQLTEAGPPVHEGDRALVTKYWRALDRIVPPRR